MRTEPATMHAASADPDVASVAALVGLHAERTPAVDDVATPPPTDQPAEDVPPATDQRRPAPPATRPRRRGRRASTRYGEPHFGMTAEEGEGAWTKEARGGAAGDPDGCLPSSARRQPLAHLAFMFENDLFVRYSAEKPTWPRPAVASAA